MSQGQYKDTKGVIRSRNSRKAGQYKHIHIIIDTDIHKVCQRLATGQWFSPGPPVFSTNKSDPHDIAEILLKVALNTTRSNTISTTYNSNVQHICIINATHGFVIILYYNNPSINLPLLV